MIGVRTVDASLSPTRKKADAITNVKSPDKYKIVLQMHNVRKIGNRLTNELRTRLGYHLVPAILSNKWNMGVHSPISSPNHYVVLHIIHRLSIDPRESCSSNFPALQLL